MKSRLICNNCGLEAPTRDTQFSHNVGMFVARQEFTTFGPLCKRCVHRCFRMHTAANLVFSWWGFVSFIAASTFLISNILRYLLCLNMPSVPGGAREPVLSQEEAARMGAFEEELVRRVEAGENPDAVAMEIGPKAELTPGQIVVYPEWLIREGRYQKIRYAKYIDNPDPAQQAWW